MRLKLSQLSLTTKLLIALSAFTSVIIICLAFSGKLDIPGLLLNFVSEILGIIVTVFYVEKVLSKYDESKWQNADRQITDKVKLFAWLAFTVIHVVLHLDIGISYQSLTKKKVNPQITDKSLLKTLEHEDIDKYDFEEFDDYIAEGKSIISLYGNRIDPFLLSDIMSAIKGLETVRDQAPLLMGHLPTVKSEMKKENTNKDIKQIELSLVTQTLATHFSSLLKSLSEILEKTEF